MVYLIAYLDPGAGSIVLQMILAGILGLSYTVKIYWRRIMGFFRREKPADRPASEIPPIEDNP